jgi:PhzF family phenazine biosynthesis protein
VDAFTTTRFGGNPAAVCLVPKSLALSSTTMQSIAAENNLPETAFLQLVSSSTVTEHIIITACSLLPLCFALCFD